MWSPPPPSPPPSQPRSEHVPFTIPERLVGYVTRRRSCASSRHPRTAASLLARCAVSYDTQVTHITCALTSLYAPDPPRAARQLITAICRGTMTRVSALLHTPLSLHFQFSSLGELLCIQVYFISTRCRVVATSPPCHACHMEYSRHNEGQQ